MPCRICGQPGHNRRTCPLNTIANSHTNSNSGLGNTTQVMNLITHIPTGDIPLSGAPLHGQPQGPPQGQPQGPSQIDLDRLFAIKLDRTLINKSLKISNNTEYDIYIYFINRIDENQCTNFSVAHNDLEADIKYLKLIEHNDTKESIGRYGDEYIVSKTYYGKYNRFSEINMCDILKIITLTDECSHSIKDNKSEIEIWKESTLKSKFILDEIKRLATGHSDIIDSLIDCVQDIQYPQITEEDKEHNGVPSTLTNITTITNINENIHAGNIQQNLMNNTNLTITPDAQRAVDNYLAAENST
jgi:hypothetical protein